MKTLAPSHGPHKDAQPPDQRDPAARAGDAEAARKDALRSIVISIVGLLAVVAMILTLTATDPGLAR